MEESNRFLAKLVLFTLIFGVLITHLVYSRHRAMDDSFITYRFSKNLADGQGIVWNYQGERTEGYTNFLLLLMLVPSLWIGLSPLLVTRVLSILALLLIAWLSWILICRLTPRKSYGVAAVGLILTNAFLAYHSMLGMETMLFTALVFWLVLLFKEAEATPEGSFQKVCSLVVAGFAAGLMRPEGFGIALSLMALTVVHNLLFGSRKIRRDFVGGIGVFVFFLSCYLLWKFFYFGSIFPNSAYIKCSGVNWSGVKYVGLFYIFISPLLILAFWGLVKRYRQIFYGVTFCTFLLFSVSYALVEPLMGTGWRFLIFSLPVFLTFALIGLEDFLNFLKSRKMRTSVLLFLAVYLFAAEIFSLWYIQNRNYADPHALIGKLLSAAAQPHSRLIALEDQGKIPYYSGWNSIDIAGLTTNDIARRPDLMEDALVQYCLKREPDMFIVGNQGPDFSLRSVNRTYGHGRSRLFNQALFHSKAFRENYVYAGTFFCTRVYYLNLFVRKNALESQKMISLLKSKADFDLSDQYLCFLKTFPIRALSVKTSVLPSICS